MSYVRYESSKRGSNPMAAYCANGMNGGGIEANIVLTRELVWLEL